MLRAHIALKNHAKIFWGGRIINFEKKGENFTNAL